MRLHSMYLEYLLNFFVYLINKTMKIKNNKNPISVFLCSFYFFILDCLFCHQNNKRGKMTLFGSNENSSKEHQVKRKLHRSQKKKIIYKKITGNPRFSLASIIFTKKNYQYTVEFIFLI